jgi:hypothetical protein
MNNSIYDCKLEAMFENFLIDQKIQFTRPERDRSDPANLDFFLPAFDTYVEVKQFHTDRIAEQVSRVQPPRGCIVIVGESGVRAFIAIAMSARHV